MKHLPILLGIALGFVAPFAARADTVAPHAKTKAKAKSNPVVVTAPTPRKTQPTRYEITNVSAAGSHLPVVVAHHEGLMYTQGSSFTPHKEYRRENGHAEVTGASDVGGELLSLDPAFH